MKLTQQASLRERIEELRSLRKKNKEATGRPKRKRLSAKEKIEVLKLADGKCHICGGDIEGLWQADHVRAHSAGGEHAVGNYLAAHNTCNNYRWDYLPEEFELILKLGVWAKTQIGRGSAVGQDIEKEFSTYEAIRIARRKGATD